MNKEQEKKNIESTIESSILCLMRARFFEKLSKQEYNKSQLTHAFNQYYYYCDYFPKMLSYVVSLLSSDEVRAPLVNNLWEEHGCGDVKRSHRALYKKFIHNLGEQELVSPFSCTEQFLKDLENLTQNSSIYLALGALGPGTESVTTRLYSRIVSGLKNYPCFDEDSLEFFNHHIEHDDHHATEIWESIAIVCQNQEHYQIVKDGAIRAIEIEERFWNNLDSELRGL